MTAFELRPLARIGENAWKLIVYGQIIKFNALAPSIGGFWTWHATISGACQDHNAYIFFRISGGGFCHFFLLRNGRNCIRKCTFARVWWRAKWHAFTPLSAGEKYKL